MGDMIRMPYTAKTIAEMRNYIDTRFADVGKCQFGIVRAIAHDALDKLFAGEHLAANIGIQKLGPEGTRDIRNELRRLGIELESTN